MADKKDFEEIDDKLKRLRSKADEWTQVSFQVKLDLLNELLENVRKHVEEWTEAGGQGKNLDKSLIVEEWQGSVYPTVRIIRTLIDAYEPAAAAEKAGKPIVFKKPPAITEVNGQKRVTVYPGTTIDGLMFPGVTAETWLLPGKEATQGTEVLEAKESGKGAVALILGAGNQSSIPFSDALFKLYNQNQVCIVKHNPVAEWLYPVMEKIMEPFISRDYFHHVKGGIAEGSYLVDQCDNIHITGSDKTHDAIVWGNLDKETADKPNLDKEITSELGCVSPFIVVPGNFTDAEMDYVIQHIVGAVINNNSCNCNAAKIIVTQKSWSLRDTFLKKFRDCLAKQPRRYAYYPGSEERYKRFIDKYENAEKLGDSDIKDKHIPWTLITDIPPKEGEYALCTEPFCPIISEVSLDSKTVPEFIADSVEFANNKCWGNLTMSIFVDPQTEKEHQIVVDKAIEDLNYGGVSINCWAGIQYSLGTPLWGAFPNNTLKDIQSGRGFVHNTYLLDHPQKSVIKAPFMLMLGSKYPYFPGHKNALGFMKQIVEYVCSPNYWKFMKTMYNALWG